jgi:tripartite-type tricarboxylate transporter receptor subunit TctC
MRRRTLALAALLAAPLFTTPAAAQGEKAYPSRPVRVLVGFPPGGSTDIFARAVADSLSKQWNTPVVVENRAGANGIIATEALAQSPPDGYTLMFTISSHVTNRPLYPKLPYNPLTDFAPISLVARAPFALVTNPSFGAKSITDLIRMAKERPRSIDYGSPGTGSSQQLAVELFNSMAGIQLSHVAYKGGAPALTDLMAGVIPISLLTTTQVLPQVQDGKLRVLGVTSTTRSPMLPDVPTIAEAGVSGYDADVWYGMIAPAGTPKPIIDKIQADIARGLETETMKKSFAAQDATIINQGPEDFAALMRAEDAKWSRLIREANIKVE